MILNLFCRKEVKEQMEDLVAVTLPLCLSIHLCHCISEVIDISPGNLDSSLCFFQYSVSHDIVCLEVK